MFTRPANLLVLDEPTNDLDIETLEVLERKLREYKGTLIVVTHDREFIDNVVTSTVVFEEDGKIKEYVGGYKDWLRQGHDLTERDNPDFVAARRKRAAERKLKNIRTKLSYKDQRELDLLPADIETLEETIAALQEDVSSQEFYSQEHDLVQAKLQELAGAEQKLEKSVERWGELESLSESFQLQD